MPAIRIRDAGGPYVVGYGEAFYAPFTAATGIAIERMVGGVEPTAMIEGMVRSGEYAWDMALVSHAAHLQLAAGGFLAAIGEPSAAIRSIPEQFRSGHFVGNDVLAIVLAVHARVPHAPASWADLWNTVRFPGQRALRAHPIDTLEMALLADGVTADALYPLDAARAFASLDRIRPAVVEWWPRASRTEELMREGEVEYIVTSSIRAQAAIDSGAPYRIAWGQALLSCEGFVILRGAPQVEACREFIRFAATAERQAAFTHHVAASPTIPDALHFVQAERAALLPLHPANRASAITTNSAFWSKAKDALEPQFTSWLAA